MYNIFSDGIIRTGLRLTAGPEFFQDLPEKVALSWIFQEAGNPAYG